MFRISAYSRLFKSIAFTMLAAGLTAAQVPAGAKRPATVPADYVLTPFGYFHPSCVNHLAEGDVSGRISKLLSARKAPLNPLCATIPASKPTEQS